jgi:hypothetical protein
MNQNEMNALCEWAAKCNITKAGQLSRFIAHNGICSKFDLLNMLNEFACKGIRWFEMEAAV